MRMINLLGLRGGGSGRVDDGVAAVRIEAGDARDRLDAARRPRPAMKTTRSIASAISRRGTVTTASWTAARSGRAPSGTVGVDGGDPAGMAGVPGLEHVERLAAAHLADDDAVGAQPQRRADQVGHADAARPGAQRDVSGAARLQLARVLDQDDALVEPRHLGEQRVGERRLARAGAAGDEDVAPLDDGQRQQVARPAP
jgi:hypothetical protein